MGKALTNIFLVPRTKKAYTGASIALCYTIYTPTHMIDSIAYVYENNTYAARYTATKLYIYENIRQFRVRKKKYNEKEKHPLISNDLGLCDHHPGERPKIELGQGGWVRRRVNAYIVNTKDEH